MRSGYHSQEAFAPFLFQLPPGAGVDYRKPSVVFAEQVSRIYDIKKSFDVVYFNNKIL